MGRFFCGWYFRCQAGEQALAVISSVHRTKTEDFCAIQVITDAQAFYTRFPISTFHRDGRQITLGGGRFGAEGLSLALREPGLNVTGSLRFGPLTPLPYDIMGPFRYVPFMQCRHSVFSMRHSVTGDLTINEKPYVFQNALGYLEGDRGRSFPRRYLWTQCFFPEGSLMLSIGDIPMGGFHFTGIIGVVLLNGKQYRLATYQGARAVRIEPEEIVVRQGSLTLIVRPRSQSGHALQAPVSGAMERTIREHPACPVFYRFSEYGVPLLELDAAHAALEYEYGG